MTKARLALAIATLLVFCVFTYKFLHSQVDGDKLIQNAAAEAVGRNVGVTTEFKRSIDVWEIRCGKLVELDGQALRLEEISGEAAFESDLFCALMHSSGGTNLVEFDFGSTDMPAMDWIERHDLPIEILAEEQ